MASRLIQFISRLHMTSKLSDTNSWAVIATWRRYFKYKEERDMEEADAIEEAIEEYLAAEAPRPIEYDSNRNTMRSEVASAHRDAISHQKNKHTPPDNNQIQRIDSPDLTIPDAHGDPRYLAQ
mmetsp:Transcript_30936/g.35258  ORF Transcript_30936/g.35258 Transcript_30936/m.35258 type:complete len:123 (+) Transcript_30936:54-422(+)|eukprot:CAMPEP_0194133532 /NCGR_PEP_ID=MMETSP0152-20130528/3666_1 /TAXON_ID=1049557 /ORGANISM="Thalassiothrix antarctica, Strain L6-D1" /LENGTH=122 /DNA_ID=CAMNT_0038828859 /DNA_START=54 /DNA_END=422 /DNA_ORIENTATION=+